MMTWEKESKRSVTWRRVLVSLWGRVSAWHFPLGIFIRAFECSTTVACVYSIRSGEQSVATGLLTTMNCDTVNSVRPILPEIPRREGNPPFFRRTADELYQLIKSGHGAVFSRGRRRRRIRCNGPR